eukprot:ctg_769.g372
MEQGVGVGRERRAVAAAGRCALQQLVAHGAGGRLEAVLGPAADEPDGDQGYHRGHHIGAVGCGCVAGVRRRRRDRALGHASVWHRAGDTRPTGALLPHFPGSSGVWAGDGPVAGAGGDRQGAHRPVSVRAAVHRVVLLRYWPAGGQVVAGRDSQSAARVARCDEEQLADLDTGQFDRLLRHTTRAARALGECGGYPLDGHFDRQSAPRRHHTGGDGYRRTGNARGAQTWPTGSGQLGSERRPGAERDAVGNGGVGVSAGEQARVDGAASGD